MKVALTGHRPERLGLLSDEGSHEWENISDWLVKQITDIRMFDLIQDDTPDVYCGMASGSDILFGMIASIYKASALNIKLHCVLPCKEYNSSNKYYQLIKDNADEWVELSEEFYKGCDNVRDQYMVDHCDVLLAIWDGNKSGGVWSTIRKAQKAGKQIIYCPKEIVTGE